MLVAACYFIAAPAPVPADVIAEVDADDIGPGITVTDQPIEQLCDELAKGLRAQLPASWSVLVHEPFVLAGDLATREIDATYRDTVVPTVCALRSSYFQNSITYPISMVLCSSDEAFRACNLLLDNRDRNQYSGVYLRKPRRLIVNVASGDGTLAHELTHALAHADFPKMPEWFDEGLAALHEECSITLDGRALLGNDNWRTEVARDALEHGELRLLQDVASKRFGLRERANHDYAYVRTFCLYLQERDLLKRFYQLCRTQITYDPTGLKSLCHVAQMDSPRDLDDAFHAWLLTHKSNQADSSE